MYQVSQEVTRGKEISTQALPAHVYLERGKARSAARKLAKVCAIVNRMKHPRQANPDRFEVGGIDAHGPWTVAYVVGNVQ